MTAEKLRDRWLKSKVELAPDEAVLDRGYFWYRARWWQWTQGILYLTSKRLIWLRATLSLPLGPRRVEIALSEIKSCERRRPALNLQRSLVVETADGGEHRFSALWPVENAGEWEAAVAKAMEAAKSA
jgi:hypothetical protein